MSRNAAGNRRLRDGASWNKDLFKTESKTQARSSRITAAGIEFDHLGIRAAKVTMDGKGGFKVVGTSEVKEKFAKDTDLIKGLHKVRKDLAISRRDILVSCLSGKQIHAAQITFKQVPQDQMVRALKLQLRKTIHFELAGATLEFQNLDKAKSPEPETEGEGAESEEKREEAQIMVGAAANVLVNRHVKTLKQANLIPRIVEVFPLAAANALGVQMHGAGAEKASMSLYFSPSVCLLIIDGPKAPFFHRNIFFSSEELFNSKSGNGSPKDVERRLRSLGDEINRSRTYYENNFPVGKLSRVYVTGPYADNSDLIGALQNTTGLQLEPMNLEARLNSKHEGPSLSPFNLAISLALGASPVVRKIPSHYSLNLIQRLRQFEARAERRRLLELVVRFSCFGALLLSVLFTVLKVTTMNSTIQAEQQKLQQLDEEYRKYTATKMIVNKADIELLDSLQRSRIFWTRKLASMALHLPDNYWITEFKSKLKRFHVIGYGYISPEQKQLITLDDYLNRLRRDTTFNDDFGTIYLDLTERDDEEKRQKSRAVRDRVIFEYTAVPKTQNPLAPVPLPVRH